MQQHLNNNNIYVNKRNSNLQNKSMCNNNVSGKKLIKNKNKESESNLPIKNNCSYNIIGYKENKKQNKSSKESQKKNNKSNN